MALLNIAASGFIGANKGLNGPHAITLTKDELLKATWAVGQQIFSAASPYGVSFAMYKALAMECSITFSGVSLVRPSGYTKLDPSEKANLSYWTGMTLAALAADRLLKVSQLVHVSSAVKAGWIKQNPGSKTAADLIGLDSSWKWHVVEAKARKAKPSEKDWKAWKKQACGTVPKSGAVETASVSLTHVANTYSVSLCDPPRDQEPTLVEIDINSESAAQAYYGPLLQWIQNQPPPIEREDVRLWPVAIDAVDRSVIWLGSTKYVLETAPYNKLPERTEPRYFDEGYVGSDGIAVFRFPPGGTP